MSAAEKLRALGKLAATGNPTLDSGLIALEWEDAAAQLLSVLPQIVALVEWTERYADSGDWHAYSGANGERMDSEMDTLLAALDEALT